MRVCMVYIGGLTPRKGGGVASVINNIVKQTAEKIDYSLLTVYDETELRDIREIYPSTVKIEYVKPAGTFFGRLMHHLLEEVPGEVDVLHFHDFPLFGSDFPLSVKGYLKKMSLIYSHHIGLEQVINDELAYGGSGRVMLGYYHWVLGHSGGIWRRVVANSRYVVDHDLGRFKGLKDKVCIIRNGVDVDRIRRQKPIDLEGEPSILFVGHLLYRKGIDILLTAFNKLLLQRIGPNPMLHIVGSGQLENSCREYVANHELSRRVRFFPGQTIAESLKFGMMKGADMIVVPSRHESFAIVVLEAMAAGKPIVTTRVGGIPEFFEDAVNGILTYPSSDRIATAIKSLCENRKLAEEYGKNNEKIVRSFDWKNIAQSYVDLYNSVSNS